MEPASDIGRHYAGGEDQKVRTFPSGATRDTDEGKLDYEGFLSPGALRRFAQYMHKHRRQSDGTLRDSDNWQKGIPFKEYVKSLLRHLMDLWLWHRDWQDLTDVEVEDLLCAILFNIQGALHETLRGNSETPDVPPAAPVTKTPIPAEDLTAAVGRLAKRPPITKAETQMVEDYLTLAMHRLAEQGAFPSGTIPKVRMGQ